MRRATKRQEAICSCASCAKHRPERSAPERLTLERLTPERSAPKQRHPNASTSAAGTRAAAPERQHQRGWHASGGYLHFVSLQHVTAARVWTGNPDAPWARSISIDGGRVTAIDENPAPSLRALDLGGTWILPGFIDAHLHLLMGGLSLRRLDLSSAKSRGEFEQLIAQRTQTLAPGQWLEAWGWDESRWDGERPTREWLRAAGDRPAVAWRCDQHSALVNDAVIHLLDLRSDPVGGSIVRDSSGAPTGLLLEQAAWKRLVPCIPAPSLQMRKQACAAACAHLLSVGITSAGAMEYLDDIESVLAPAREDGSLSVRVRATVLDRERPLPFKRANAVKHDDFLRVIGFKSFADGTLGSSTASMLAPYSDAPDNSASGALMEHALEGTLATWMREVLEAGYSPSVHAIGDRALTEALKAAVESDPHLRVRFEHAQTVDPYSLEAFRGRILSMQPFHKATDAPLARVRLGAERENRTFRFREFLKHRARLAFGSDWPIVTADPLEGMRVAITGRALDGLAYGTSQNLTPHEAITAYTTGAANALDNWTSVGSLTPGNHADFVALDRDPLTCDWLTAPPQVLITVVGGVIRHDARATPKPA